LEEEGSANEEDGSEEDNDGLEEDNDGDDSSDGEESDVVKGLRDQLEESQLVKHELAMENAQLKHKLTTAMAALDLLADIKLVSEISCAHVCMSRHDPPSFLSSSYKMHAASTVEKKQPSSVGSSSTVDEKQPPKLKQLKVRSHHRQKDDISDGEKWQKMRNKKYVANRCAECKRIKQACSLTNGSPAPCTRCVEKGINCSAC
jgi:hypothetical protein